MLKKIERNEKIICQCAGVIKKLDENLIKQQNLVQMLCNDFAERMEREEQLSGDKGYA